MPKLIYVDKAGKEVPQGSSDSAYQVNMDDPHSMKFLEMLRAGTPPQTLVTKKRSVARSPKPEDASH